jgi:Leucine-rich repeat (LRR) protein
MKQLWYRQIKKGVLLFGALVLSSSSVLADFKHIDCVKNKKILEISTDECKVLEKLWDSTNGEAWLENRGWDTLSSISTWEGITLENHHVTSLLLYSNNLKGKIPSELGKLSELKRLSLARNNLSGEIPISLEALSQLVYLDLSNNQLSGTIPLSMGTISLLKELYLNNNQLSGKIPNSLGDLAHLEVMKLYKNNLVGEIPPAFGALLNLESLSLSENNLTGAIPSELGQLISLTYLDLKSNRLSGMIPVEFGNLEALTGLYLQHNQLSGTIPSSFGSLSGLSDLDLSDNNLSGSIPASLGSLSHLTYLNISHNRLGGDIPVELVNLEILNYLNLNGNKFVPSNLEAVSEEFSYIPDYNISYTSNSEEDEVGGDTSNSEMKDKSKNISIDLLSEDEVAMLEVSTLKLQGTLEAGDDLEVEGEGRWSIDGEILSFTPLATFTQTPSSIFYTIKDANGIESAPIEVSIKRNYALSSLCNILDNNESNLSVRTTLQPSKILEEKNLQVSLSDDGKSLAVEGEGVWRVEDNGTAVFVPEEGFNGTPTEIKYVLLNKTGEKSAVGLIRYKEAVDGAYDSSNNVSLFGINGLLFMILFGGLFGMFYIREIENKK